ncbi:MAG: hypothetical protein PVJ84_09115 [Desulfobacteraceae bacterium]|jgi:hypothetical protein
MAKIIPLAEYKERVALRAVGRYWDSLFEEPFDAQTRLADLSPKTLFYLAEPGDESSSTLYALIIGLFGFDETTTFRSLNSKMQNHILDIHLFISDQIRFEMMYRLGWLERFVGNHASFFEMVTAFVRVYRKCRDQPPLLARDHADYKSYAKLIERDQQVFIRRMMISALDEFKKTHKLT